MHTMDKNEIAFLDTIAYRSPTNRIYTRIYHKPTDQKHYLHYYSAHSRNQKESSIMAFSLDVGGFVQKTTTLRKKPKIYNQLKNRKYPSNLLNQTIE